MEELVKFIESKQGGKMNSDYKQGIDDCIDLINDYQAKQLILSAVSQQRELLLKKQTHLNGHEPNCKCEPCKLLEKIFGNCG